MPRRALLLLAALALVAVVTIGLLQSTGGDTSSSGRAPTQAELEQRLAGAPAPLARLHARPNALLPADDAERELAALKGHPVVVNKWASWCGPCRAEFPTFQEVSAALGKEVAFLGLDADDARGDAEAFLDDYLLSYPSIYDPRLTASDALKVAATGFPTTIFYDKAGTQTFVHQGPYLEAKELREDIETYARG